MSYTPTIVIRKDLLAKREVELENDYHADDEENEVIRYLRRVYKENDAPMISGVELLIFEPKLTYFNERVREKLMEWGIEYGLSN